MDNICSDFLTSKSHAFVRHKTRWYILVVTWFPRQNSCRASFVEWVRNWSAYEDALRTKPNLRRVVNQRKCLSVIRRLHIDRLEMSSPPASQRTKTPASARHDNKPRIYYKPGWHLAYHLGLDKQFSSGLVDLISMWTQKFIRLEYKENLTICDPAYSR